MALGAIVGGLVPSQDGWDEVMIARWFLLIYAVRTKDRRMFLCARGGGCSPALGTSQCLVYVR